MLGRLPECLDEFFSQLPLGKCFFFVSKINVQNRGLFLSIYTQLKEQQNPSNESQFLEPEQLFTDYLQKFGSRSRGKGISKFTYLFVCSYSKKYHLGTVLERIPGKVKDDELMVILTHLLLLNV